MKRKKPVPRPSSNGRKRAPRQRKRPEVPNAASEDGFPAICAVDVREQPVQWLSRGRLALGAVTLLDGSKGSGKSALAATIAAAVTGGPPLPDQEVLAGGDVLWFAGEEDLSWCKKKLYGAGTNLLRVHFPGRSFGGGVERELVLPGMIEALDHCCERYGASLIVLDTLSCFVGGCDLNQEQPCRAVMSPLTRLAEERQVCVILVRHPRKTPVAQAIDRGLGNPALAAAARSVLATGCEQETGLRLLGVVRCNLGHPAPTVAYSLEDGGGVPVVRWGEVSKIDAERFEPSALEVAEQLQRMDARKLLRARIGKGWVQAKEILAEGRQNGISEDALQRARAALNVPTRRVGRPGHGGHWEWGAPEEGWGKDCAPPS